MRLRATGALVLLAGAVFPYAAAAQSEARPAVEEGASGTAGDIIVTARRREERLQDVPVSVQAFSQEALQNANVSGINDLEALTPTFKPIPSNNQRHIVHLELRGISSTVIQISADPAVGVYMNETPFIRPFGFAGALFDLENVQVLYGPQGTLFGRNHTGGALLVTTKRPMLGTIEGEAAITVGNYDRLNFEGVLNLPVGETVAVRLAGRRFERDGYTYNRSFDLYQDDENFYSLRGSIYWEPSESFNTLLVADYFKAEDNGPGVTMTAARPGGLISRRNPTLQAWLANQLTLGPRSIETTPGEAFAPDNFVKSWGVTSITRLEVTDGLELKAILSHREGENRTSSDTDGSPFLGIQANLHVRAKNNSAELNASGQILNDKLTYVVGGFWLRETGGEENLSAQLGNVFRGVTAGSARNISKALYAQGTLAVPGTDDNLKLTFGGRYTWDDRVAVARSRDLVSGCQVIDPATGSVADPCAVVLQKNFGAFTYNLSVDYRVSPELLVYVAHRRGYRSGGFNYRATSLNAQRPVDPEHTKDVEIGLKSDFRLGEVPVRFNLAAFKAWQSDLQRNTVVLLSTGVTTLTTNAAKAEVYGGEASLTIRPVPELTLNGNVGYANGKFTAFDTVVGGVPTVLRDLPFYNYKWTGSANASYEIPFGENDQAVVLFASYNYHSRGNYNYNTPPNVEPEAFIPADGTLNAAITWRNVLGSPLSLKAFCDNLTNNTQVQGHQSIQAQFGVTTAIYNEPRMYGLEARVKF
jgi:iron complex outermembrane recepter protein